MSFIETIIKRFFQTSFSIPKRSTYGSHIRREAFIDKESGWSKQIPRQTVIARKVVNKRSEEETSKHVAKVRTFATVAGTRWTKVYCLPVSASRILTPLPVRYYPWRGFTWAGGRNRKISVDTWNNTHLLCFLAPVHSIEILANKCFFYNFQVQFLYYYYYLLYLYYYYYFISCSFAITFTLFLVYISINIKCYFISCPSAILIITDTHKHCWQHLQQIFTRIDLIISFRNHFAILRLWYTPNNLLIIRHR